MEELQDAIEDAQYINAMNDTSPKPTKEWCMPTPEVLANYLERIRACNPEQLTLSYICSTPLGFYLVLNAFISIYTLFLRLHLLPSF